MSKLFTFWFPNQSYQSFWFDGTKDDEIHTLFYKDLQTAENTKIETILLQDLTQQFDYLILFDQITRNTARITKENEFRNDDKALCIARNLFDRNFDSIIPFLQRIFMLLPFRHTYKLINLDFVISKLNTYHASLQQNENTLSVYTRFYIATLKNYSNLNCTDNINIILPTQTCTLKQDNTIHDDICTQYTSEMQNTTQIAILKNNKLYNNIIKYCKTYRIKKVGVSLSGGVDSMVLLYLLQQMVLQHEIEDVVAIHINYNFSKTSTTEATFLANFCDNLNIKFVLRNITHFNAIVDTKIDISRDIVEEETKTIRFNTYKYAIQKYNLDGICLGHHKDDLIENVFMNMSNGKNILDLFVMKEYIMNQNIVILRPMLEHHKTDIYEIAHKFNILYFKDTTPEWSFRGTMRNKIFPQITNFSDAILANFHRMGQQSKEWGDFIQNKIIGPILEKSKKYKHGFSLNVDICNDTNPVSFWEVLLSGLFHKNGKSTTSQKNLKKFTEWTAHHADTMFRLSNGYISFVCDNTIYFMEIAFYETLRSELKDLKFDLVLKNDANMNIKMSLWNIAVSKQCDTEMQNIINYENILNGCYEYCVSVTENFSVGVYEKNKLFRNVSLLSHLIPKISETKNKCATKLYIKCCDT